MYIVIYFIRLRTEMEFTTDEYKRSIGRVFTTSDGNKYIQSKLKGNYIYLRCVLFRNTCKATSKLNRETNLITPLKGHNHDVDEYRSEIFALKTKCKTMAKNSQTNLRKVFDDATRDSQIACEISFPHCELSMYRARKTVEPKIPSNASEFLDLIPNTTYGKYFQFSVTSSDHTGVIFFSEKMSEFLSEVTNIQFDGTFYTCPVQFYQLWTVFVSVGRHTLPAIHCLLTGKGQELYEAVINNIFSNIPHFRPLASMSDWEPAARNAMKKALPNSELYGCWFHFTQRIWAKTQNVGLAQEFRNNQDIECYIKQLMAIPYLPSSLINPTYTCLQMPSLDTSDPNMIKLQKLKKYFKKRWLSQIEPGELSVYNLNIATNNAAESYHSKIKSIIRTCHPRIWTFIATLNDIIQDTDNDIGRLQRGLEISRPRKREIYRILNVEELLNKS